MKIYVHDPGGPVPGVLTDRIAAWLLERGPGWRLPRRTDLARRYKVTAAEIDAAITDLADRGIVRAMADGQIYRASPAEYLITLDQMPFLGTRIDPMSTSLTCASRRPAGPAASCACAGASPPSLSPSASTTLLSEPRLR